ncbi:hypothetical protein K0M31_011526 [Melipona bicolor]|uniref:Secreted protein n=1 Tax=Melipona bicolor TaxID=60889 RepID=A0AA40KUU4_9HYME|nr:hypothetical protein K0M31_011526 [Melipona bicolor]
MANPAIMARITFILILKAPHFFLRPTSAQTGYVIGYVTQHTIINSLAILCERKSPNLSAQIQRLRTTRALKTQS